MHPAERSFSSFDDMLNKFDAPRHRLSSLIQGMLDVNARILQYGSAPGTGPEDQLLKRVWLRLKIWYRSVPLTDSNPLVVRLPIWYRSVPLADSNPLVVAWCSFITQYKYPGTANESTRIDEEFLLAYIQTFMRYCNLRSTSKPHTLSMCISTLTRRDS